MYVSNVRHPRYTRFRFSLLIMPLLVIILAACSGSPTPPPATSAPDAASADVASTDSTSAESAATDEASDDDTGGDAARGAELFTQVVNGAPSCSTCHATDRGVIVGPGFEGYADVAATRVEGQSAEEYTHNSIVRPAEHVVSGYSNSMYNQYERYLSEQDIADLIAYLLTL